MKNCFSYSTLLLLFLLISLYCCYCKQVATPAKYTKVKNNQNDMTWEEFPEQRLANHLLTNYTPWAKACRDCTKPIKVAVEFSLMQINSLDEKSQVLTTTGWLTVRWFDDRLVWEPSDFNNLTTLEIPANLVWVPIFGLDNHARNLYDHTFRSEFFVRVDYDGQMHWDVGNQFVSSCRLSLFYYPWDRQACVLSFQSYSHTAKKMQLYADKSTVNLEDFTPNGEWNISNTTACHVLSLYNVSSSDGFWSVNFEIQLTRKPTFYIFHIITPCVVLSVLVFIVFWLPPEAGEKVSLAMTILLSFSVFLLMIAENMPKTSDSVPLLAMFLASFMAASAVSIVFSVWILRSFYHDLNCKSRRTGRWGRAFIRRFAFLVDVDSNTVEAILAANLGQRCEILKGDIKVAEHDTNIVTSGTDSEEQASAVLLKTIEANFFGNSNISGEDVADESPNNDINYHRKLARMANDVRQLNRSVTQIRSFFEHSLKRRVVDDSCIKEWRLFALTADRVILFLHMAMFSFALTYISYTFGRAPTFTTTGVCDEQLPLVVD